MNDTEKKHILVVSQYFYPEQFRINDICTEWILRGYKVTVLTGIPNYPQGKFYEGYDLRHNRTEEWNGVKIVRIPLIPRGISSVGMVMNYMSFVLSGMLWKCMTDIRADLVFIYEVSPMTQALVGVWYAKKRKIPCYLYVTDLWPENVEEITGIHSPVIVHPIQKMTDYIYKNCTRIFTSSVSFIDAIKARNIPESKIEFWPQYAEDYFVPVKKSESVEIPLDGVCNFVFAGNLGYAQALWILVDAAAELKKEQMLVRFNIIGDGRYKEELLALIQKKEVGEYFNFIERKLPEEIPQYLANADVLLITLSKSKVFSITIPAKTQSCMACGKPILVAADGEVQQIVLDAKAGLAGDAEDCKAFVFNIKKFMKMDDVEMREYGENALAYSKKNFNKKRLLDHMDEVFQQRKAG